MNTRHSASNIITMQNRSIQEKKTLLTIFTGVRKHRIQSFLKEEKIGNNILNLRLPPHELPTSKLTLWLINFTVRHLAILLVILKMQIHQNYLLYMYIYLHVYKHTLTIIIKYRYPIKWYALRVMFVHMQRHIRTCTSSSSSICCLNV